MIITHEEVIETRISLLKQMHKYIIDLNDEKVSMDWFLLGIPRNPSKYYYIFIAENEKEWISVCTLFGQLTKERN